MNEELLQSRLSEISTHWTLVREAHGSQMDVKARAQSELIEKYSGAAYRYLCAALRDPG